MLDGHSLDVKPSEKRISAGAARGPGAAAGAGAGAGAGADGAIQKALKAGAGSSKLIVRNLAFQVRFFGPPGWGVSRTCPGPPTPKNHTTFSGRQRRAQGAVFRFWGRETRPNPQKNGRGASRFCFRGFFDRPGAPWVWVWVWVWVWAWV